jgi:hypothetical protein
MAEAAPGWYPDPSQPGMQRWWDGSTWSEHVAPMAPSYPMVPGYGYPAYGGQRKSLAAALILAFFFGPFGLLYATVPGGLIMLGVALVVGLVTFGLALPFVWIGSMVWAAIAVDQHNDRVTRGGR